MNTSRIDRPAHVDTPGELPALARRMRLGGAFGAAQQVIYWGSRFVVTPLTIARVGYEGFGFWAFLFLVMGMAGLSRTGILAGAVPRTARLLARGDHEGAGRTARAASSLALGLGAVFGLPLALAAPLVVRWIGVPGELIAEAVLATRLTVFSTWIALGFGGAQIVLEARHEFAYLRTAETAAVIVETALLIVLLGAGWGLPGLAIAYAVRQWAPLPFYFRRIARAPAAMRAVPGAIREDDAREILKLGGALQGIASLQMFGASAERAVAARGLSLAAAGAFEAARKLTNLATTVPAQLTAPLTAGGAARAATAGTRDSLKEILRPATRLTAILAGVPLAFAVTSSREILTLWLGSADGPAAAVLPVFAIAAFVHVTTGPATALQRSVLATRNEIYYTLAWMLGAPPLLLLGLKFGGAAGTAVGAALAQALPSLWLLMKAYPLLGARRRDVFADVFLPFLIALSLAGAAGVFRPGPGHGRLGALIHLAISGASALGILFLAFRRGRGPRPTALTESLA